MAKAKELNTPKVLPPLSPPTKLIEQEWDVSLKFLQSLKEEDDKNESESLSSKKFYNEFLHVWKASYDNLMLQKKVTKDDKKNIIVGYKISLFLKDQYMGIKDFFDGISASSNKKSAKGRACYKLLYNIRNAGFNYRMVRYTSIYC